MRRQVVCFHYFYPPLGGVAARRAAGLARHLPEHGWAPIVITPALGHYYQDPGESSRAAGGGAAPLEEWSEAERADGTARRSGVLPGEGFAVTVVRTRSIELSRVARAVGRWLPGVEPGADEFEPLRVGAGGEPLRRFVRDLVYVPDAQIGWLPFAVRAGVRAARRGGAVLYSSSFPITAHLSAMLVSRRTGLPWLAEFRDLWTRHHLERRSGGVRRRVDRAMERAIVAAADVVVTVTDEWRRELAEQYADQPSGKFRVLTNGYEAAEFAAVDASPDGERFRLVYVGTMYGEAQDPEPLFRALAALVARGIVEREQLRFEIVGRPDARAQERARALGVEDLVKFTGFVGHREAIARQKSADVLVVILDPADERLRGCVPGKVFEYLAAERPVMAIVPPDGEVARLLRAAGNAWVVPPQVPELEAFLAVAIRRWRAGQKVPGPNPAVLSRYRYDRLAGELAAMLSELAGS